MRIISTCLYPRNSLWWASKAWNSPLLSPITFTAKQKHRAVPILDTRGQELPKTTLSNCSDKNQKIFFSGPGEDCYRYLKYGTEKSAKVRIHCQWIDFNFRIKGGYASWVFSIETNTFKKLFSSLKASIIITGLHIGL